MHKKLNRFNWRNFLIKHNWLTWRNNQTCETSETVEIAQSILDS